MSHKFVVIFKFKFMSKDKRYTDDSLASSAVVA